MAWVRASRQPSGSGSDQCAAPWAARAVAQLLPRMPEVVGQGEQERSAGEDLWGTTDTTSKGAEECAVDTGNKGSTGGGRGAAEPVCFKTRDRGWAKTECTVAAIGRLNSRPPSGHPTAQLTFLDYTHSGNTRSGARRL